MSEDRILPPRKKNMDHYKVILDMEGKLKWEKDIRNSDFNVMYRAEIYGDEIVDEIVIQVVIRHIPNHFLDLYVYENESMNEVRHVIHYKTLTSIHYEKIQGEWNLKMVFDNNTNINVQHVPIEIATWMINYFSIKTT